MLSRLRTSFSFAAARQFSSAMSPDVAQAASIGKSRQSRRAQRQKVQIFALTDRAADRVKALMLNKSDSSEVTGVKVGLKRKGCNGLTYTMKYITDGDVGPLDEVVVDKGVKIVVDNQAVMFVAGTEMDYVESETGSEFTFENPNKKSECGCGQSFNV